MKTRVHHLLTRFGKASCAVWVTLALFTQIHQAFAQGTAFTYQGRLNDGGSPATGIYDLRFTVCDALASGNVVAGPLTNSATGVTNGLFTVTLDFGGGVFTGPGRWLEVDVRSNGSNTFTPLLPLQPVLPMPFAIMANTASNLLGTLPAAQLSGTVAFAQLPATVVTNGATGVNVSGTFSGDGSGLVNVPGTVVWQTVASTNLTDASNEYYLLTNKALVTLNLSASPNVGDVVTVSGAGANGFLVMPSAGQTIAGIHREHGG